MKHVLAFATLMALPTAGFADPICDDLWLTRNMVMDRAGFCFGSVLGKAVFSNADCTTKTPNLSQADKQFVARVRAVEKEWACNVNTGVRRLEVEDIAIRFRLHDLPLKDEFASSCIGWLGDPIALLSAHQTQALPIGTIEFGDTIHFGHWNEGNWEYVTVYDPDQMLKAGGWVRSETVNFDRCRNAAG